VQRIALPFAGDRVRRLYKAHRSGGVAGLARDGRSYGIARGAGVSSLSTQRAATGGVRVDRVGAKLSPRAIAVGGAWPPRQLPRARSLAREILAGCASREASPSAFQDLDRKVQVMKVAVPVGDCWQGSAEFGDSWLCSRIVSIAEVDKRRVAPRARGRRVRGADDGSSPPTRERSGG
jgi:hypothetical protein